MSKLLLKYIRMAIDEAKLARVPNQLIEPDSEQDDDSNTEVDNVDEYSGAGSIAGYVAPLGVDPNDIGRKKNKV